MKQNKTQTRFKHLHSLSTCFLAPQHLAETINKCSAWMSGALTVVLHVPEEVHPLKDVSSPIILSAHLSAFLYKWKWFQNFTNVNRGLQIYLQFFPCDVSYDAALFYFLLAACICQNFIIVYDRDIQITCNSETAKQWSSQDEVMGE